MVFEDGDQTVPCNLHFQISPTISVSKIDFYVEK